VITELAQQFEQLKRAANRGSYGAGEVEDHADGR